MLYANAACSDRAIWLVVLESILSLKDSKLKFFFSDPVQ